MKLIDGQEDDTKIASLTAFLNEIELSELVFAIVGPHIIGTLWTKLGHPLERLGQGNPGKTFRINVSVWEPKQEQARATDR